MVYKEWSYEWERGKNVRPFGVSHFFSFSLFFYLHYLYQFKMPDSTLVGVPGQIERSSLSGALRAYIVFNRIFD